MGEIALDLFEAQSLLRASPIDSHGQLDVGSDLGGIVREQETYSGNDLFEEGLW